MATSNINNELIETEQDWKQDIQLYNIYYEVFVTAGLIVNISWYDRICDITFSYKWIYVNKKAALSKIIILTGLNVVATKHTSPLLGIRVVVIAVAVAVAVAVVYIENANNADEEVLKILFRESFCLQVMRVI